MSNKFSFVLLEPEGKTCMHIGDYENLVGDYEKLVGEYHTDTCL